MVLQTDGPRYIPQTKAYLFVQFRSAIVLLNPYPCICMQKLAFLQLSYAHRVPLGPPAGAALALCVLCAVSISHLLLQSLSVHARQSILRCLP